LNSVAPLCHHVDEPRRRRTLIIDTSLGDESMQIEGAHAEITSSPEAPRASAAPVQPKTHGGFLYQWGPQAWIDMWMSYTMLVKKGSLVISHTFRPILRITTDPDRIEREYAEIKSRREKTRLLDSPRERWRKNYGNFVREIEWALLELRDHYPREQYEEIVIGTVAAISRDDSASFIEMMNSMADTKPSKKADPNAGPQKPGGIQKLLFDMFNPAGFLTGPAEISEFDPARGEVTMEVPDCAWHVCAKAESLPNPNALPEEGCLLICKGVFEHLFNGENGGLGMEFDPHLPETSCTVRMHWKSA
jgi:hypothetical protein